MNARCDVEIDIRRHRDAASRIGQHFLREAAIADRDRHAVADFEVRHAFAQRLHDAGDFAARRERQRRLELVLVLEHQHVGKVHAAGLDRDQHLVLSGRRRGHLAQFHFLRRPVMRAKHGFHDDSPIGFAPKGQSSRQSGAELLPAVECSIGRDLTPTDPRKHQTASMSPTPRSASQAAFIRDAALHRLRPGRNSTTRCERVTMRGGGRRARVAPPRGNDLRLNDHCRILAPKVDYGVAPYGKPTIAKPCCEVITKGSCRRPWRRRPC